MPEPGITRWDRLVRPYFGLGLVTAGSDEELLKRQHARLSSFERLVSEAQAAKAGERAAKSSAVGREYLARLREWSLWHKRVLQDDDYLRWWWAQTMYGGTASGGSLILGVPIALVVTVVRRACRLGRMDRSQRALERRCCPDCRFDLSATPPPIEEVAAGCWIGPDRCPECGGRWPLVPPRAG